MNKKIINKNTCRLRTRDYMLSALGKCISCIKIGYRLFEVDAVDTASQILFAGCRFTLAGILAAGIGSVMEGRFLRPERKAAKEIIWLSLLQTIIQLFLFLYGTCTYQWSKSFYYRSGEMYLLRFW